MVRGQSCKTGLLETYEQVIKGKNSPAIRQNNKALGKICLSRKQTNARTDQRPMLLDFGAVPWGFDVPVKRKCKSGQQWSPKTYIFKRHIAIILLPHTKQEKNRNNEQYHAYNKKCQNATGVLLSKNSFARRVIHQVT